MIVLMYVMDIGVDGKKGELELLVFRTSLDEEVSIKRER